MGGGHNWMGGILSYFMRTPCQPVKSDTGADCCTAHRWCSGRRAAEVCKQQRLYWKQEGLAVSEGISGRGFEPSKKNRPPPMEGKHS